MTNLKSHKAEVNMLNRTTVIILSFLFSTLLWAQEDEFNAERLPIGNPHTKYDFCAIKLNQIFDTNSNTNISLDQLIDRLKEVRIIMVGENHTSEQHHLVQLKIIKGLIKAGMSVCLALEMFNESQNEALNNYISGKTTEEEFLDQSGYFNTWGHNYRYYKPIFNYARENRIKMFGVNIEREYVSKIGSGGFDSLSLEEQKVIPEIDTTNVEHRFYIKVAMEGMDATLPAQFKKIYAAQCLWDAAMGEGAIKIARQNPASIVIILAGSGHVVYNLGIGKIIKKRSQLPFASVVAIDVSDTVKESVMMKIKKSLKQKPKKENKMRLMQKMHATEAMNATPYKIIVRSLADFLWGVPKQEQEKYPSFGFSIKEKSEHGFEIKRVIPETIAEKQGIQRGDIIVSIDGKSFDDVASLKKYLGFKNWNDSVSFNILRDGNNVKIEFVIKNK